MKPVMITAALVVSTAALALAACSGTSSSSASAVNPVPILQATGATVPAGTVTGSHDVEGDRYASGSFPGGEQVTVYTCTDQAAFVAAVGRMTVDDVHGLVTIPGKLALVTTTGVADLSTGGYQWGGPDPAQIATAAGGLVIEPQGG